MAKQRDQQFGQGTKQPQGGAATNVQVDESLAGAKPEGNRQGRMGAQPNIQSTDQAGKRTPQK